MPARQTGEVGCSQAKLVRHSGPKGGATDRPSRTDCRGRPERFPGRGLKERRGRLSRSRSHASVGQYGLPLWDETVTGEAKGDASVKIVDPICRTAVYVTRMYGGVGGERP